MNEVIKISMVGRGDMEISMVWPEQGGQPGEQWMAHEAISRPLERDIKEEGP